MLGELLNKFKVEADSRIEIGEKSWRQEFQTDFDNLVGAMAPAYTVEAEVYGQEGASRREKDNQTLNNGKYFLDHLEINREKEKAGIVEYAKNNTVFPDGKIERLKIGNLKLPVQKAQQLNSESSAYKTAEVVMVLAKRAAQLKALTQGEEGIPEAYTLARMQTNKALELVKDAATIAYGWKADSWGRLSLEEVLERASKPMLGQRAITAVLIGALVLAGCQEVTPGVVTPETGGVTPIAAEVVTIPEMVVVETNEIIPDATPVPYPDSAEGFVLGVGGDVEQLITAIDKVQNGAATDMKNNYIARAWREGRVTGGDWEAAVKNFESKFEIIGAAADEGAPWTLVVRERSSGKVLVAFDAGDNPFLSGMPLGAQSLDAWHLDFVSSDVLPAGQREMVVRVGEGESAGHFVVVRLDEATGEMVSWRNMVDRSWVEAPQELDITSLVEAGQEIREVNGYQAIGSEYTEGFPDFADIPVEQKVEFRMTTVQGKEGTYRALNGVVEKNEGGEWQTMEWPADTRAIAFFDIKDNNKDGKQEIYAIDEYGIAVGELKNGKWEKYVREVKGFEDYPASFTRNYQDWNEMFERFRQEPGIMDEIDITKVVRQEAPNGQPLDWDGWWSMCIPFDSECSMGEVKPKSEGDRGIVGLPAIIRGFYPGYWEGGEMLVFELPRRYNRVMIYTEFGKIIEYTNVNAFWIAEPGVDWWKLKRIPVINLDIMQARWINNYLAAVAAGEAPNYQVVVDVGAIARYDKPGSIEVYKRMAEIMADQELSSKYAFYLLNWYVVPQELGEFVP